jgi:hypothetical protein
MNNSLVVNLYPKPTGEADQRLTVSTTVVFLTENWSAASTKYILIDIQTADVYVTFDGSDPSSSNGHLFKTTGQPFFWSKEAARVARFIRAGATDGFVMATPFTV